MKLNRMPEPAATPTPSIPKTKRLAEFISRYANNVQFESSPHDLKLIFGQTDLSGGEQLIEQHTAIAIPWALARTIAGFYLPLVLRLYEAQNGSIKTPPSQIPDELPPPSEEQLKANPKAFDLWETAKDLRAKFLETL